MSQDPMELMFERGIDVKNRKIYFGILYEAYDSEGSDFTWRSVENAIRAMHFMENESPHKPIELHMSSPGGDPLEMFRLIDAIEQSPCQIKFFGSGRIMSAATWVMAVCDERYLSRNTRLLLHDAPAFGSVEAPIKLTDRRIDMEEEEDLQDRLNKLYANNSRMSEEFYKIIVKRDCFLSADEAVSLGLADKVLEPKKRGNLRRMRLAQLNKQVDKVELTKLSKRIMSRVGEHKVSSKMEIHAPEEQFDSKVFVEDKKAEPEVPPADTTSTITN